MTLREPVIRLAGLILVAAYAAVIVWLFANQPRTVAEAVGGVAAGLGAYEVDAAAFDAGLAAFRQDRFGEARAAFARADPAVRDASTQFYIAYSFYREGWRRTHRDDELYRRGLAAADRASALAPGLIVDDPTMGMRTPAELRAELEAGLTIDAADFNPLRVFESRK